MRHVMTTSYHPQANGWVECVNRRLKDGLPAQRAGMVWPSHLSWVLLGLHAAPMEISGFSSSEAVFGQPLVLSGELTPGDEAPPLAFRPSSYFPASYVCQGRCMASGVQAACGMAAVCKEGWMWTPSNISLHGQPSHLSLCIAIKIKS
jgi:hypothetical protein